MLKKYIKLSNKKVLLPLYHTVSDTDLPHISNLYSVKSISEFKKDIDYILRYFKPIDLDTLIDHIKNNKPFMQSSVYFTFDDGLREIYDVVSFKRKFRANTF